MTSLDQYMTKAVWLMDRLLADFRLLDFQAAGIAGNGYQEPIP